MEPTIPIFCSANRNFEELLLGTVATTVESSRNPQSLSFTIMDRGLSDHARHALECHASDCGFSLEFLKPNLDLYLTYGEIPVTFQFLRNSGHYDRLLIPAIYPGNDPVLYLDSDLFVMADVADLYALADPESSVTAAQDFILTLKEGLGGFELPEIDLSAPYFNSGVLLIQPQGWREREIPRRAIEATLEYHRQRDRNPPCFDQYGLNIACYQDWGQLPDEWNTPPEKLTSRSAPPKILHFAGKAKPYLDERDATTVGKYYGRQFRDSVERLLGRYPSPSNTSAPTVRSSSSNGANGSKASQLKDYRPPMSLAPAHAFGHEPDKGPVAVLIPVLLRSADSLRFRNFRFLLSVLSQFDCQVLVVQQLVPEQDDVVSALISSHFADTHLLSFSFETDLIKKTTLINRGSCHAFENLGARYVWQLDADIYVSPAAVLRHLSIYHSKSIPVIKPYQYFLRLSERDTRNFVTLTEDERAICNLDTFLVSRNQIMDLFGPGSVIYSKSAFASTGGMDESYEGWGWEDMDFAARLSRVASPHFLPLKAVHLYHEDDRRITSQNFREFQSRHNGDAPEEAQELIRVTTAFNNSFRKYCLVSPVLTADVLKTIKQLSEDPENHFAGELMEIINGSRPPSAARALFISRLDSTDASSSSFSLTSLTLGQLGGADDTRFVELISQWADFLIENGFQFHLLSEAQKYFHNFECHSRYVHFLKILSKSAKTFRLGLNEILHDLDISERKSPSRAE